MRELRRFLRKQEPNLSKVGVRELLEAVVRFVSPEARGKEVDVAIDMADGLPDVMADRVQIQNCRWAAVWRLGCQRLSVHSPLIPDALITGAHRAVSAAMIAASSSADVPVGS